MESVLALNRFSGLMVQTPKDFFGGFLRHLYDHFIPHHRNNYHPYVFSHRLASLFAILLVAVKIFTFSQIFLGPAIPAFSSAITPENIISLTNESRTSFGLKVLAENAILSQAAQSKADDMALKGYFAHKSPDGKLPWDFIESAGYNYIMAGENLAVNFVRAENVSDAWMNSPAHKANILNKNFEEIGIGIAQGEHSGKASTFVVQMFGVPAEEKVVLKNQPSAVESKPIAQSRAVGKLAALGPEIIGVDIEVKDSNLIVSAKADVSAIKVLAVFGARAAWLYPKGEELWQGQILLEKLTQSSSKLSVKVFDISGNVKEAQAAVFAADASQNYNFYGQVAGKSVVVFGRTIDLESFEYRFYLIFVAAILTCLILAITIKRHIQHVSLVANGSFLAILAVLLWMG